MATLNENIQRIENAKLSIKTAIESKGVTVPAETKIEGYSALIDSIPTGGGSGINLDLTGTGWENEPTFPVDVTRIGSVEVDLDITRARYSKWVPGTASAKNFYFEAYDTPDEMIYAPKIDTKGVTDMNSMFFSCEKMSVMSSIDTSSVTNMANMFADCFKLTNVPMMDTSKAKDIHNMFQGCDKLATIPAFNTAAAEDATMMFYKCFHLKSIPELDFKSMKSAKRLTGTLEFKLAELSYMGGFKDLKVSLDLSNCPSLTKESIMNVINNLGTADPLFEANPTLTLASGKLSLLSAEEQAIATNKGWALA